MSDFQLARSRGALKFKLCSRGVPLGARGDAPEPICCFWEKRGLLEAIWWIVAVKNEWSWLGVGPGYDAENCRIPLQCLTVNKSCVKISATCRITLRGNAMSEIRDFSVFRVLGRISPSHSIGQVWRIQGENQFYSSFTAQLLKRSVPKVDQMCAVISAQCCNLQFGDKTRGSWERQKAWLLAFQWERLACMRWIVCV
jgi:hypothetical protein